MNNRNENEGNEDWMQITPDTESSFDMGTPAAESSNGGKKKFTIIGIIVAVLLVVGVAGAMNAKRLANLFKEKVSSPEEYYQYVEQENRDAALEEIDSAYDKMRENLKWQDKTQQMTCQIELGDTLKALASSYGIESVGLVSNGKVAGNVVTGNAKLQINEKDAVSYNAYMDYSTGESYIQIPELTSSYLDMTSTFQEASAEASLENMYSIITNMDQYLPKTEQLNTLITTYSDIVFKNLKNVKRSEDTLKVGDISKKYTKLDVTCDGEDVITISKKVLEQLKDDKVVKELVENINSDGYEAFQNMITEALDSMEETGEDTSADDAKMEMSVYVDKEAKIVGRVIKFTSDGESFEIKEVRPQDGAKFGYELAVSADDVTYVSVTGSGQEKNGKLSGDFSLSLDESLNPGNASVLSMTDLVKLSVKDLDQKALSKDGVVKGSLEISSEQIPAVAGYSLKIEMDGDKEQIKDKISVMVGSDEFATMNLTIEEGGEDPGVTKPAADAVTYDLSDELALSTYTSEIDLVTFLTDLKTNCGVDLTALIGLTY